MIANAPTLNNPLNPSGGRWWKRFAHKLVDKTELRAVSAEEEVLKEGNFDSLNYGTQFATLDDIHDKAKNNDYPRFDAKLLRAIIDISQSETKYDSKVVAKAQYILDEIFKSQANHKGKNYDAVKAIFVGDEKSTKQAKAWFLKGVDFSSVKVGLQIFNFRLFGQKLEKAVKDHTDTLTDGLNSGLRKAVKEEMAEQIREIYSDPVGFLYSEEYEDLRSVVPEIVIGFRKGLSESVAAAVDQKSPIDRRLIDNIKNIFSFDKTNPAYISSKKALAERIHEYTEDTVAMEDYITTLDEAEAKLRKQGITSGTDWDDIQAKRLEAKNNLTALQERKDMEFKTIGRVFDLAEKRLEIKGLSDVLTHEIFGVDKKQVQQETMYALFPLQEWDDLFGRNVDGTYKNSAREISSENFKINPFSDSQKQIIYKLKELRQVRESRLTDLQAQINAYQMDNVNLGLNFDIAANQTILEDLSNTGNTYAGELLSHASSELNTRLEINQFVDHLNQSSPGLNLNAFKAGDNIMDYLDSLNEKLQSHFDTANPINAAQSEKLRDLKNRLVDYEALNETKMNLTDLMIQREFDVRKSERCMGVTRPNFNTLTLDTAQVVFNFSANNISIAGTVTSYDNLSENNRLNESRLDTYQDLVTEYSQLADDTHFYQDLDKQRDALVETYKTRYVRDINNNLVKAKVVNENTKNIYTDACKDFANDLMGDSNLRSLGELMDNVADIITAFILDLLGVQKETQASKGNA